MPQACISEFSHAVYVPRVATRWSELSVDLLCNGTSGVCISQGCAGTILTKRFGPMQGLHFIEIVKKVWPLHESIR